MNSGEKPLVLTGVDQRTGAFRFPGLPELPTEVDVVLSPTEREELRRLAIEGGPLGRIMSFFQQYQLLLMLEVAQTPLVESHATRAARDRQVQAQSVGWMKDLFERLLSENLTPKTGV